MSDTKALGLTISLRENAITSLNNTSWEFIRGCTPYNLSFYKSLVNVDLWSDVSDTHSVVSDADSITSKCIKKIQ